MKKLKANRYHTGVSCGILLNGRKERHKLIEMVCDECGKKSSKLYNHSGNKVCIECKIQSLQ